MKKVILSLLVTVVFSGYAVYQGASKRGLKERALGTDHKSVSFVSSVESLFEDDDDNEVDFSTATKSPPTVSRAVTGTKTQNITQAKNINNNLPSQVTPTVPTQTTGSTKQTSGQYKDGVYTGDLADAFYGNVRVQVTISGAKLSDVEFIDYPNDRSNSIRINTRAMPLLKSEAIQAQSASVDIVSGATATSEAFIKTLQSALDQAKV
jgi:uncharacterized protein with FMN-binding domain